jgi:hypothetical protein
MIEEYYIQNHAYSAKLLPVLKDKTEHKWNHPADLSLNSLQGLKNEAWPEVRTEDLAGYCKHVTCINKNYWTKDRLMEDPINKVIISLEGYDNDEDNDEHHYNAMKATTILNEKNEPEGVQSHYKA